MSKFISISVTNLGTRPTKIEKIRCKKALELMVVTVPNLEFPKKLEVGEKVEFKLPYNRDYCEFLLGDCSLIGLEDPFDKIHWAKRQDFKKVCTEWQEDLERDEVPQGEGTIHHI